MQKSILITGAAGFIGFHCAQALAKRGEHVIGLDNFNAYYSQELKRSRAAVLEAQGITVHKMDLNDRERLQKLFHAHPFTHVLHLAAQAGVRFARSHPEAYLESNLSGFLSLLEILKSSPGIKLVYASSSSVYGCNAKIPFSTEDRVDHPANLYAATKKANELMAYSYHHLYGIAMTGLRYFTVYGPWGRPDMAYYHFAQAISAGEPLRLFNQGLMKRDFTFIDDAASGTLAALDHVNGFDILNIGRGEPVEVLLLVELLEKKLGKKAAFTHEVASQDEIPVTYADIHLTRQKIGYEPKISLEEGISHFVAWYLNHQPSHK